MNTSLPAELWISCNMFILIFGETCDTEICLQNFALFCFLKQLDREILCLLGRASLW